MKKILFITSRLPYPPNSGRKNVMYNYCKYLNEKFNMEIINASFLEDEDDIRLKPKFISKVYKLNNISNKTKIKNLFFNTLIKKEWPMQVSLFYDLSVNSRIKEIIEVEKPDILMCDMVRTAEYIKDLDIKKILDLDDLISIRYKRQLKIDMKYVNPYGAYLYRLPKLIQKCLSFNVVKRFILKNEVDLLEKYEVKISKTFDSVIFVSEKEANTFNSRIKSNKSLSVPLGVDIDYFSKYRDIIKEENSISFLGAMNVAHNETAVVNFCEKILPQIIKKIPNVKFYIVGGGVTDKVLNLQNKNVIVVGKVDDVRKYISKTKVFVCPLLFGSGIKTKNLEAMAMGVPVVTNSIGAESISALDGTDWIIRDNENDFASEVIKLLEDKNYSETISKNAYNYVKENYSWQIVSNKWKDVFKKININ